MRICDLRLKRYRPGFNYVEMRKDLAVFFSLNHCDVKKSQLCKTKINRQGEKKSA